MRLLNIHTLELDEFMSAVPEYLIASHRWCEDETTYQDVKQKENQHTDGYRKVRSFADFVKSNIPGIDWIWIDTCCIDKRDGSELGTAINSMFQWYRDAALCLAYLADVPLPEDEEAFKTSIWFTRGWTLQELLAPRTVLFLSEDWQIIGHKGGQDRERNSAFRKGGSLNKVITALTRIPEAVLSDYGQSRELSEEEKWAWIDDRTTTRDEDMSYCLLGIFDIDMNIRYGGIDAGRKARERLEAKIKKKKKEKQPATLAREKKNEHIVYQGVHGISQDNRRRDLLGGQSASECSPNGITHSCGDDKHVDAIVQVSADIVRLSAHLCSLSQQNVSLLRPSCSIEDTAVTAPRQSGRQVALCSDLAGPSTRSSSLEFSDGPRSHRQKMKNPSKHILRLKIRLAWISSRVWDVAVTHATSGWDTRIRLYNEVPANSMMFEYCIDGNLAKMQELVAAGSASWLDRSSGETLLSRAACHGHVDLCRFLLREATWPDHMDVMHDALAQSISIYHPDEIPEAMFRLCIEDNMLDVDLSSVDVDLTRSDSSRDLIAKDFTRASTVPNWWGWCPTNACRTIILNNMSLPWSSRPTIERFHLATKVIPERGTIHAPDDFLQLTGLRSGDARFAVLRRDDGLSILHYVAHMLWSKLRYDISAQRSAAVQEWLAFGVDVLQTGIDPHCALTGRDGAEPATALLSGMSMCFRSHDVISGGRRGFKLMLGYLRLWLTMVQDAGLNIHDYVSRENAILKTLDIFCFVGERVLHLTELVYGGSTLLAMKLDQTIFIPLYKRIRYPGTFDLEECPLPTICWEPSEEEFNEGHWAPLKPIQLPPATLDVCEQSVKKTSRPFLELVEKAQDDTGVVVLMVDYSCQKRPSISRCHSSPAPFRRRERSYLIEARISRRPWLSGWHPCLWDPPHRNGCSFRVLSHQLWCDTLGDTRSCSKPAAHQVAAVQNPVPWLTHSFLAEINDCRAGGTYSEKFFGYKMPTLLRHTGTSDCPQGCARVRLDKTQAMLRERRPELLLARE